MTPRPYSSALQPSPARVSPAPMIIPAIQQKSNLELLYEASPEAKMPNALNRNDSPLCRFWEEPVWAAWVVEEKERGSLKLGVRGQGANSSWMEDRNGQRLGSDRQKKIFKEMRATWRDMQDFNIPLKVLTGMPATSLNYFRARMESVCPELQLCADHWKVDQLWMENFSGSVFRPTKRRKL